MTSLTLKHWILILASLILLVGIFARNTVAMIVGVAFLGYALFGMNQNSSKGD
jgi:hypothetical protein